MLVRFVSKFGYKIIANPELWAPAAPILIPVVAAVAIHDAVEYFRK